MQAIARFEPERGFRLSTYAMWWIRAQIQEYILANWSMVKIGTTSSQKKLFFNLKRLRNKLRESGSDEMSMDVAETIAEELGFFFLRKKPYRLPCGKQSFPWSHV